MRAGVRHSVVGAVYIRDTDGGTACDHLRDLARLETIDVQDHLKTLRRCHASRRLGPSIARWWRGRLIARRRVGRVWRPVGRAAPRTRKHALQLASNSVLSPK